MFKKILSGTILASIVAMQSASAETLMPPSLQQVMKHNEAQAIQNAKNIDTTPEKPTVAQKPITLTYRTISTGKAITIHRANEAMIWVQEIDLAK